MAIIGSGFDDLSLSSEGSYSHVFLNSEAATVKGQHFQRGQLLRGPRAACHVDPSQRALINVGGVRYVLPWSTLEEAPSWRLSRLRSCSTLREIAQCCDDYDQTSREFFFDRDPLAFGAVFNFLAKGKLRLLQGVCNTALHSELLYWGIDVRLMEPCCRRLLLSSVEEMSERRRREDEWRRRRRERREMSAVGGGLLHRLGEAVENPRAGVAGRVFAYLSIIMVAVTVVSLCISTMPDLHQEESVGKCSEKCRRLFLVESVCVAWFTLEFVLGFFHARNKLEFIRRPLNVIDAAAILPYYMSLFLELEDEAVQDVGAGAGKSTLDKLGLILRVMRALRILYVMKLARHSLGLQTLGLTMHRSLMDFGLLLLFIAVAVTLFSPLVHLAESEMAPDAARMPHLSFSSIPASYWWSIISVTTVGYGDMVPHSIPGQLVALISILAGILILSFPSTSIFHTFHRSYMELKEEQKRLWVEERSAELATEAEESTRERETWPSNWPENDFLPGLDDPCYLFNRDSEGLAQSRSHQTLQSLQYLGKST